MGPRNAEYGDYEQMSVWLERQQRRIEDLEAENRDLRRQLDELRRGVGVSVMIHGRAIPLASPSPSGSAYSSDGPASSTPRRPVPAAPISHSYGSSAPQPSYAPPAPPQVAARQPAPASYPDNDWLTGPQRPVKASPHRARAHVIPAAPPRARSASQEMTPSWLRSDAPAPQEPRQWRPHARTDSLPVPPRLEPIPQAPQRTLAQITGQQHAMRPDESHRGRNPYSDSFVLG
jgi:hypothetical protein